MRNNSCAANTCLIVGILLATLLLLSIVVCRITGLGF